MSAPRVSVVVATYDASHLLRYAISSVLLSEHADFEIVVVGDHCSDDSEAVLAAFGDERIRFINLPRNSGQQATPNNVGVRASRGQYLCFLNQDDLFMPHHLSQCLERIERTGADILCPAYPVVPTEQLEKLESGEICATADGFEPSGRFSPRTFHVASSWFMRREVAGAVGPWRQESQTWVTPSQDWLFRAWRAGQRIDCAGGMSVAVLYSGMRRDSYRKRESPEHEFVFRNVVESDRLRAKMIETAHDWIDAHLRTAPKPQKSWLTHPKRRARELAHSSYDAGLLALGIHPRTGEMMRAWGWRRGSFVRRLQEFTG